MSRPISLTVLSLALLSATSAHAVDPSRLAMQAFEARQAKLAALGDTTTSSKTMNDRVFTDRFEPGDQDCSLDTDGDTLPDCAETGTGVFVDVSNTGTSATLADTDGDGIDDGDEVVGTDAGLDLPALGVNPLRKDLLIEYDWFDDAIGCGAHSHAPSAAVLARVAAIFANAPVTNPDGSTGINLIQDAGQGGVLAGGNRIDGHSAELPGTFDATWDAIKAANFDPRRAGYFHYQVLAHRYGGGDSSGFGEVVGDDTIVSLQCSQTEDYAVRTIAHELGHNLGLNHGGFEACNNKPNYSSLMNYRYQFYGIDTECNAGIDPEGEGFSHGDRITINEAAVDEQQGVCGNPAIDWNFNGSVESGVAIDLNVGNADTCGAALSELRDFDDWGNITLLGILDGTGPALKTIKQEVACGGAPVPPT
jgi:hypothetical protein